MSNLDTLTVGRDSRILIGRSTVEKKKKEACCIVDLWKTSRVCLYNIGIVSGVPQKSNSL